MVSYKPHKKKRTQSHQLTPMSSRFPPFLRGYMQAGLTATWTTHVCTYIHTYPPPYLNPPPPQQNTLSLTNPSHPSQIPLLQISSPAQVVAHLLRTHLGPTLHSYNFIDFCAGGGGPTPSIERHLNRRHAPNRRAGKEANGNGGHGKDQAQEPPLHFVLTDLCPHPDMWAQAAAQAASPGALSYVAESVDAADVPRELIRRYTGGDTAAGGGAGGGGGKKVFRLFNLAFHHFDDGLARRILRDTVEGGGEGFGYVLFGRFSFLLGLACLLGVANGVVATGSLSCRIGVLLGSWRVVCSGSGS